MIARPPYYLFTLIFIIALIALYPGIMEITGITGKDEYYLTIRTPIHMIEGQHGWLPWLDGLPRLQKPPLIYWLGKLSYELFGISLLSARMIGVSFAATLITTSSALAWLLTHNRNTSLLTGLVILGMAGIMIDGRRYLLDIPVAAFSGLAVLSYLLWYRQRLIRYSLLTMLLIGLAFLTKGPVTLIFFFTALIAWQLTGPERPELLANGWIHWGSSIPVALLIVLPWYAYIFHLFPEDLTATLQQETYDRNILNFSLSPLLNLIIISLPWSPVLIGLMINYFRQQRPNHPSQKTVEFLFLWLFLSLLPFFFFKTFGRYLYGCLIPLSILIPVLINIFLDTIKLKVWFRFSALFTATIGSILFFVVIWFREVNLLLFISALSIVIFIVTWWQVRDMFTLASTAVFFWLCVTSIIYPAIGINRIPDTIFDEIKNEYVVLYAGPQPAMLPAASGRGLRATSRLWTLPEETVQNCKGILLFTTQEMEGMLKTQMQDLKLSSFLLNQYYILSSRGSWVKFTRKGTTSRDWLRAFKNNDIDSLGSKILLFRIKPNHCK